MACETHVKLKSHTVLRIWNMIERIKTDRPGSNRQRVEREAIEPCDKKACFDSLFKIFWLMFRLITKTQLILATHQKHLFLISSLDSLYLIHKNPTLSLSLSTSLFIFFLSITFKFPGLLKKKFWDCVFFFFEFTWVSCAISVSVLTLD